MFHRHFLFTTAIISLLAAVPAEAQQPPFGFLPVDRTYNGPGNLTTGVGSIIVGYEKLQAGSFNTFLNASSPTITYANMMIDLDPLYVYNDSNIVAHESELGNISTFNDSTLILDSNGKVDRVFMNQNSQFIMNSGAARSVTAQNFSKLTISGGQIGYPDTLGFLAFHSHATATVTNCTDLGDAKVYDDSALNLVSSTVNGSLEASGTSASVTAVSSTVGRTTAYEHTKISLTDSAVHGSVNSLEFGDISLQDTVVDGGLNVVGQGHIDMTSGYVGGSVVAQGGDGSIIMDNVIFAGGDVFARDDGTLSVSNNLSSAIYPNVYSLDSSKVTLHSVHVTNVAASGSTTDVFDSQVDGSFGVGGFAKMNGGTIAQDVTVAGGGNGSFSDVNIAGSVIVYAGTGAFLGSTVAAL
jgi:hypothetical protein